MGIATMTVAAVSGVAVLACSADAQLPALSGPSGIAAD